MPGDWEPLGGSMSQSRLDSGQQFIAAIYKDISSGLCGDFYMTLLKKEKKVLVGSWNFFRKNLNIVQQEKYNFFFFFSVLSIYCYLLVKIL